MSNVKVAVDAGHGSETAGKRTPPFKKDIDINNDGIPDIKKGQSLREHIANVGVCTYLKRELERNGYIVVKSGWNDENSYDDEDVDIITRQRYIRENSCKYSVSVHFNAYGSGSEYNLAEGVATYIHSSQTKRKQSLKLAVYVQNYLVKGTTQKNRGILAGSFGMCNTVGLGTEASILVELAFMTNEREATELMCNEVFWKECGIEICKGICDMDGKVYKEEVIKQPTIKHYLIQAGSFLVQSNAEKLLEKLKNTGYKNAYIKISNSKIKKMYIVLVGSFNNKDNAMIIMNKLKDQGFDVVLKEENI